MRLTQIELPLDSATRLVLQHAAAKELVNALPFGGDQQKLDLVMTFGELSVAVAPVLDVLEPGRVLRTSGWTMFSERFPSSNFPPQLRRLSRTDRSFPRRAA